MSQYVRNKGNAGGAIALATALALSTTTKKFGAASLQRSGPGQLLSPGVFPIGTGDFCVEAWGRWDVSNTNNAALFSLLRDSPSLNYEVYRRPGSGNVLALYNDQLGNTVIGATVVPDDTFVHVAVYRASGVMYLAVGGVVQGSVADTRDLNGMRIAIGAWGSGLTGEMMAGFVDEVRVKVGSSPYGVSNFTPPAAAFGANSTDDPDWPNTMVLYSFDAAETMPAALLRDVTKLVGSNPPASMTVKYMPDVLSVGNSQIGGRGRIRGWTEIKGTPNRPDSSRVVLIDERRRAIVDEVWSDGVTGEYIFDNVDMTNRYTALAYDETHNFRAVVADNLEPELMP